MADDDRTPSETPDDLTPADALERLRRGNRRFVSGDMERRDLMRQVRDTAEGQTPFATILGCIDSRVPPELVFDQGIGDLFSVRIAGNFVNTDILGNLEFATAVAGAKLVVVLGHTGCGAVQGAVDRIDLGHLTQALTHLAPAIEAVGEEVEGPRDSTNPRFLDAVARKNVELTMAEIVERSAVIRNLVEWGEVAVTGALHDVGTGRVTFFADA